MNADRRPFQHYAARHFHWQCSDDGRVATITLNRPEKKNPLTFDSYAELRDLFLGLQHASDVRVVVLTGAGGNFCRSATWTSSMVSRWARRDFSSSMEGEASRSCRAALWKRP